MLIFHIHKNITNIIFNIQTTYKLYVMISKYLYTYDIFAHIYI